MSYRDIHTLARYASEVGVPLKEVLENLEVACRRTNLAKIGGDCLTNGGYAAIARSVTELYDMGIVISLLHGGGSQITDIMKRESLTPEFVNRLRKVPDKKTLDCVIEGLGDTNKKLVGAINSYAGREIAVGLTDEQIVHATKADKLRDEQTGELVDFGYVGKVTGIEVQRLLELKSNGKMPVLWCIGYGEDGQAYNCNADVVGAVMAPKFDWYILLAKIGGYLEDGQIVKEMTLERAKKHVADGGMALKIDTIVDAMEIGGIERAVIASPHNLKAEILLNVGMGTLITNSR